MNKATRTIISIFFTSLIAVLAATVRAQDAASAAGATVPAIWPIARIFFSILGFFSIGFLIYFGLDLSRAGENFERAGRAKKILYGAGGVLVVSLFIFIISSVYISRYAETPAGQNNGNPGISPPVENQATEQCNSDSSGGKCQPDDSYCTAGQYCGADCQCRSVGGFGASCGQADASGKCQAGGACREYLTCQADKNCQCLGAPVIKSISPSGASSTPSATPGSFITIVGLYFGTSTGEVYFSDARGKPSVKALWPNEVNADCQQFWRDDLIIAVVPQGAAKGPIKIVRADSESDLSNDSRGPQIADFVVSNSKQLGICGLSPDRGYSGDKINLFGVFSDSKNRNIYFAGPYGQKPAKAGTDWTEKTVAAEIPILSPGEKEVFVKIDGLNSNSLPTKILNEAGSNPIIDSIVPASAPPGQYITIYGSNFKKYKLGASRVKFYNPTTKASSSADAALLAADCQNSWWTENYIIVKTPSVDKTGETYQVTVANFENKNSQPENFQITPGEAGAGICLVEPHGGPIGTKINIYGENFSNYQGKGNVVFYNQLNTPAANIDSWTTQSIAMRVPESALSGPVAVRNNSGLTSNSFPFAVGQCQSSADCAVGEICCSASTYWSGICRAPSAGDSAKDTCNRGDPGVGGYGWTFSTSPPIPDTCGGYITSEGCQAVDTCPNSPGQCQVRTAKAVGSGCGADYCGYNYPACAKGGCDYDNNANKCVVKETTCNISSQDILSGYNAECRYAGEKAVWQYKPSGADGKNYCPAKDSFMDANGWCTIGLFDNPKSCTICPSGFDCQSGKCVSVSPVCPENSICQDNKCVLKETATPVCECCCHVGNDNQSCCAGLTCKPGNCGLGAPNYGLCTGCRKDGDGDKIATSSSYLDVAASDAMCNCADGYNNRYCDMDSPLYPEGVCRDKAGLDKFCRAPIVKDGVVCNNKNLPPCRDGYVCDPAKECTCQSTPGNGGAKCKKDENCPSGADSCIAGYNCLSNQSSKDCRCCCDPASGIKNSHGLSCYADKAPCGGSGRGLFCGCTADEQCDGGICAADGCCHEARGIGEACYDGASGAVCDKSKSLCGNGLTCRTDKNCTCQIGRKVGEPCYDGANALVCNPYQSACADGLICSRDKNCTCQLGKKEGEPCYDTANSLTCNPYKSQCISGLVCDAKSCLCEKGGSGGSGGELCKKLQSCTIGADSCSADYQCISNQSSKDCRCCCDPANGDKNAQGLACYADKTPCGGSARGLFCGCTADEQCGSPAENACGTDTCCHSRPEVKEVIPADNAKNVCRNVKIKVIFNQPMNLSSLSLKNSILFGDYGSSACPSGTQYLTELPPDSQEIKTAKNFIINIFNQSISPARAYTAPSTGRNYCSVPGTVTGVNQADGAGAVLSFQPSKPFDAGRTYYFVLRGGKNQTVSADAGVISSYWGAGLKADSAPAFNNLPYNNSYVWQFTTLPAQAENGGFCLVHHVTMSPESYLFNNINNDLNEDDTDANSATFDIASDRDKVFSAEAMSENNQALSPVDGYKWRWDWTIDNSTVLELENNVANLAENKKLVTVNEGITSGHAFVSVAANITENKIAGADLAKNKFSGRAEAWVLACENPWPPIPANGIWRPWRDAANNCRNGACYDTGFEMYYCRDSGQFGTADDLPPIKSGDTMILNNPISGSDILKEFYFFHEPAPAATDNFTVSDARTGGAVTASWAAVAGAVNYKIYYGQTSGSYSQSISAQSTRTTITGLDNNTKYYFVLTSINDKSAESGYSAEVSATPSDKTPPPAPTSLSTSPTSGQIELDWIVSGEDAAKFKIYYGTSRGQYGSTIEINNKDAVQYTVPNLRNGRVYYFVITALDAAGNESEKSNEVSATPKP